MVQVYGAAGDKFSLFYLSAQLVQLSESMEMESHTANYAPSSCLPVFPSFFLIISPPLSSSSLCHNSNRRECPSRRKRTALTSLRSQRKLQPSLLPPSWTWMLASISTVPGPWIISVFSSPCLPFLFLPPNRFTLLYGLSPTPTTTRKSPAMRRQLSDYPIIRSFLNVSIVFFCWVLLLVAV